MTKFILLVVFLTTVTLAVTMLTSVERFCSNKFSVNETTYKAWQSNMTYKKDDHDLKCMIKCLMNKKNLVDEDGIFNADLTLEYLLVNTHQQRNTTITDLMLNVLKMCDNNSTKGDDCEKAFSSRLCLVTILNMNWDL